MPDLAELPGRAADAAARLVELAATLPTRAAELVLSEARPRTPRRSGALASSGRVETDAAVFGGGVVDYAAPVHSLDPFLEDAVQATAEQVADLLAADVDTALSLI